MKILIIEDEPRAAERLQSIIQELIPHAAFYTTRSSVTEAIDFFKSDAQPDVVFMDIELSDGRSFELFSEVEVTAPVVFTTAYDEFALEAFRHNGVDYLLKPIKREELSRALDKLNFGKMSAIDYDKLAEAMERRSKKYTTRILVRFADQLKTIEVDHIAYIEIRSGAVFAMMLSGAEYPLDFSLEQLEKMLNPEHFFRINRKGIVAMRGISKMYAYSRSRVKLEMKTGELAEPVVSTERSGDFKKWLEDDLAIL